MEDVTVKVEKKLFLPILIILIFIVIFFLTFLIISIIYNLMGYYIYFILLIPFIIAHLYLEIKGLTDVEVTFKKDKLILNIFVIKKPTGKFREYFSMFWKPFINCSRSNGLTRFAVLRKIVIDYHDIANYEIIKDRDLEITACNNKYLIMGSFFYYQSIKNKWKSTYKQFSKEQIQFIYNELNKRVSSD